MKNLLTWLSRRRFPYEPLITVEVSHSRLIHNLNEFRKRAPNGQVAPVLKSNAYGHGLFEVAHILKNEHVPFFVVDSYFEAVALRAKGFTPAILIVGYTRPQDIAHSRLKNISFTIGSLDTLRAFKNHRPPCPESVQDDDCPSLIPKNHRVRIHLKIDTGMHRQGILPAEIPVAIEFIKNNTSLILDGICSHFSDADNVDPSWTESQINRWNTYAAQLTAAFPQIRYTHLSATDGHRFSSDIHANVSRLGIGLYGLTDDTAPATPFNPPLDLQPALCMKTSITGIKKIKSGETVGYGNIFKAEKDMTIAIVSAGYFEGIDRRLSNKSSMLVGPQKIVCPIVGRVSMNITSIDITHVLDAQIGTEVIVISNNTKDPNSIVSIARLCGTITYEIAVHVTGSLKRIVVN